MALRILYVEDNSLLSEVTSELLAQDSREIVCAASAEEALQRFATERFDLLITDVSLPRMSGLELARAVRERRPDLPVIVASGYALESARDRLGGRVHVVTKPFTGSQIDTLIADLVPRQAHVE